MSESDLDLLYKRASGDDAARPGAAIRETILDHARELAERTNRRGISRWLRVRWYIAAPVAAAVLGVIVLRPQLQSSRQTPVAQVSNRTAAIETGSDSLRPGAAFEAQRAPPAAPTRSAPEPFPRGAASNLAASRALLQPETRSSTARQSTPAAAAPRAEIRGRPEAASDAAAAPATSRSESLQKAAARGDVGRVQSILQSSTVSIDSRDTSGRTALFLAVLHHHEAAVRALLERGANPNLGDPDGRTPLEIARDQHQPAIVAALLRAGAR